VKYHEYNPPDSLREEVKCFWILDHEYPDGSIQDVTPDGCVELICSFGSPYVPVTVDADSPLPPVYVVGFQDKTIQFRVSGRVQIVAARLLPWAVLSLLGGDIDTSVNAVRGAPQGWDQIVTRMARHVSDGDYDRAALELQGVLIQRLLVRKFDRRIVQAAANLLHQTKGQCRIEELAEYCHISVRQLQRGFQTSIGATPKEFARTLRFVAAERRLMFDPRANLTQLAYEFGYSDQAHFIKDFREFTGKTPSRYARDMERLQHVLQSKDVVFLQYPDSPQR
jgi:AraC-like DNA-binding protein